MAFSGADIPTGHYSQFRWENKAMQRQRNSLVPVGDALSGMGGPVKALREASPQARHHYTQPERPAAGCPATAPAARTLRHRLRAAWIPVQLPGLGGRGDGPSARGRRGGAGAQSPESGRGGLRPLGPVRAAAAAHGRLGRLSQWTAAGTGESPPDVACHRSFHPPIAKVRTVPGDRCGGKHPVRAGDRRARTAGEPWYLRPFWQVLVADYG